MKKLIVLFCLLAASAIKAQAPQYLNYQGIARNSGGTIITTAIGIKFEILQGSASGTLVFDETNTIIPSSAGIFTTAIGAGTPGVGSISLINWANGPYFIRVSIDPAGGTSYSTVGTSQLLSVPYALYAEKAGNTQTVSITGPNVTGTYPNYTITPAGALTASTGISIGGGTITNTAPDQTVVLTATGISSVSGTYPNFNIDVPPPALNYNTGTNVLTLTQGTAVATTTLVGAGSSTVSMFASGIASVTPVGAGNNFTVSVQSPSFTSIGSTSITGTYPNFVINSPGASTTIPTSLQINSPHTTSTLSANNFSITVAPTNITGAGVTGAYPNYTITSAAQTSVTSGGANVVVSGSAPSYTVSATTPTLQINPPNTVTSLGLNNYSITVPPTSVGLSGSGVASVSGSSPNYTVTVPGPSLTVTGNSLTLTQGTVSVTKTITASPWTYSSGVIHSNGSVLNDKVAIGQTSTTSNLEVVNNAGSTNTINPVVAISNVNSLFNASSVLQVRNTSGSGAALAVDNIANGDGVSINLSNPANGSTALQVSNNGSGFAGYFANNNATSSARVLDVNTGGLGNLFYGSVTNTLNTADAIYVSKVGSGAAANFLKNGTGFGMTVAHNGTSGIGGFFNIANSANSSQALSAQTSGSGEALGAYNLGTGRAFTAINTGTIETAIMSNGGTGRVLSILGSATSVNDALYINNPNNAAMLAQNNNSSNTGTFFNTGTGRALVANNFGPAETVFIDNSGTGRALVVQNPAGVATRAAQFVGGVDVIGKTAGTASFALVVLNNLSTNLLNVRDDGHVGIGNPNSFYRLSVIESGSNAALHGQNSNATGGGAARFDVSSATNPSDAVFIQNIGSGASIHASNGPAAGSALSLWIENGHIKSTSTAPPTSFSVTVGGGFTAPGFAPTCVGTDVKGVISFSTSATGFSATNSFDIQYNFQKAYSVAPTVILTPRSDFRGLSFMVLSSSTTNFVVRIYRPNGATFPATLGNTFFDFNYFIIE